MAIVRVGERVLEQDDLKEQAARLSGALIAAGVSEGDRVAIVMRNAPEYLVAGSGATGAGALPVPVNWHSRGDELSHVLADSGAKVVFAHSTSAREVAAAAPAGTEVVEVPVTGELAAAYGEEPATGEHRLLSEFIGDHAPETLETDAPPLSLIYTSGTTGLAKGVLRQPVDPERRLEVAGATLGAMGLRPGMHTLVTAPMYHSAPSAQSGFAFSLGIDLTIMPRFDPEAFLAIVERQRITHAQVVPTMFVRLLALPEEVRAGYDTSSLECVVHAAAPCPEHVKRRMIEWFGPVILEYYGGTELGIVVACDSEQWLAHPGSVGAAVGDAELRILDGDGRMLPAGETGEVYVRPPAYWPDFTYLGRDEKRREIERDGFLSLGDVGHLDADGFLYLSDRARDMIISGGVNIYPAEIESCLLELPGVRDVAVFGVPDEQFGEAIAAHLDADPDAGLDEASVRRHVAGRLAAYKVPRTVVFDDALPREASGKIFKRRIRERYWREAGRSI